MTPSHTTAIGDLQVLLGPEELRRGLEHDARHGLTASPKWLPPKYFYDDRGSDLFEEITRLTEYYPTRAEHSLLTASADDIAAGGDFDTLLELGSGSSAKTDLLLDALDRRGSLSTYVAVDVSHGALNGALAAMAQRRPALATHGIVADFERHLAELPRPGNRLVALLGSTLGNFAPPQRSSFLASLAAALDPGEGFLVGLDLVKGPDRLVAAYDDAEGVTAQFNKNILRVLNRELGADFDEDSFSHVAHWNSEREWMEMHLRADRHMTVHLDALDLAVTFARGERMRTEISAKFRRERFECELAAADLRPAGWWTDGDFALALARR